MPSKGGVAITDKATIISHVGPEQYAAASRSLIEIAKRKDYGTRSCPQGPDLPHEITDQIWDSDLHVPGKIELFFQIFDDLPCYGMLIHAQSSPAGTRAGGHSPRLPDGCGLS